MEVRLQSSALLSNERIINNAHKNSSIYCFLSFLLVLLDLVIIDLLWWRNTRRIRFSFLLEKTPYQDPGKHIGSFLRGIPLFAVVAVISAADISPAVGWKV